MAATATQRRTQRQLGIDYAHENRQRIINALLTDLQFKDYASEAVHNHFQNHPFEVGFVYAADADAYFTMSAPMDFLPKRPHILPFVGQQCIVEGEGAWYDIPRHKQFGRQGTVTVYPSDSPFGRSAKSSAPKTIRFADVRRIKYNLIDFLVDNGTYNAYLAKQRLELADGIDYYLQRLVNREVANIVLPEGTPVVCHYKDASKTPMAIVSNKPIELTPDSFLKEIWGAEAPQQPAKVEEKTPQQQKVFSQFFSDKTPEERQHVPAGFRSAGWGNSAYTHHVGICKGRTYVRLEPKGKSAHKWSYTQIDKKYLEAAIEMAASVEEEVSDAYKVTLIFYQNTTTEQCIFNELLPALHERMEKEFGSKAAEEIAGNCLVRSRSERLGEFVVEGIETEQMRQHIHTWMRAKAAEVFLKVNEAVVSVK